MRVIQLVGEDWRGYVSVTGGYAVNFHVMVIDCHTYFVSYF